ncbi:glycosyl hydrolase 108 family protein [Alteromonas sp. C1M14]|uniref:glycoside hydrolase family 108 protein n=1 Tax=Alteromonas sp. C1M14 TaxID=2841567 RepID=UPI001C0A3426|nr:glycosyl hydrolase 108 family protein [Alteromonas sp. C1M14]MBU2976645.1 hypothetical protein [Alteromonas sp. C1M14]
MAFFLPAFEKMIDNEGGYSLHRTDGDRGGLTYAGIARNFHPDWPGWPLIESDTAKQNIIPYVQAFYKQQFWERIRGDFIDAQGVAETIFDFAVNAGVSTAAKLAQDVVGVNTDGVIGTITLKAINQMEAELFIREYALKKMARYANIVNNNPSQAKFLLGWINRSLKQLS